MKKEPKKNKDIHLKLFDPLSASKKKGLFDKIKSIFPFFIEKQTKEIKLAGRIQAELQKDAHAVLNELKVLKDNLRRELDNPQDSHLWSSFEIVINPLIREFTQIEKKIVDSSHSIDDNTHALKSYEEWIIKAKAWVLLCSKPSDREGIIEAVIEHSLRISDDIIDRDLKTLNDYKAHELHNLGLNFEEIKEASINIDAELEPHIKELRKLKHKNPQNLGLHHLSLWKAKLDEDRARHYHAALHAIDSIIKDISPAPLPEVNYEHLQDIYDKIIYLEEELPIFLGHLNRMGLRDNVKRQLLENQLAFLEDEVHKINQDLRLTPELIDRVELILRDLEKAHQQFFS